jgi:CHAT domain-containing protein
MTSNTEGLRKYAEGKTKIALDKVDKAIRELSLKGERINFNSVMVKSGVSKAFLYSNEEVKERIELLKKQEVSKEINQRVKTDKTSKSKDIIIMAKDKKIRELTNENKKLKEQLAILRGKLYSNV